MVRVHNYCNEMPVLFWVQFSGQQTRNHHSTHAERFIQTWRRNNRELTNRRLLHDDAVGLRDMSTAHAYLGTYRRRAKVDDVGESDLPAS